MQGVTGISLQLEVASQQLPEAPEQAKQRLDRALVQLDEVVADARRTVLELKSPAGAPGELVKPLRQMAEELASARGVGVDVTVEGTPYELPEMTCAHLLRIAREAVTNSLLHGQASRLQLRLRFEPGRIQLTAADNGRGFDPESRAGAHFGLQNMRERAAAIGGELTLRSEPGEGTEVMVEAPAGGARG
jgi:signal transduction histidine kinase